MKKSSSDYSRIVGIDLGYGAVKGTNSTSALLMPSVVGAAPPIRYSDEWSRLDGDTVYDDQGTWFIGQNALMHSKNVRYIRDRGRTLMPDYKRLLYTVLGRLHPHQSQTDVAHINAVTGLPVAHMGDADALKEMFLGQHKIKTQYADGVYSVDGVAVMPQGFGTLLKETLDDHGNLVNDDLSSGRVLVIDIGRFTTNVITVDDMAYLERASSSIDAGVYVIEERLRQYFEVKHNWSDPRPDFILDIIMNENHDCILDGDSLDLRGIIADGVSDLAQQSLGLVSELVGGARDIAHMLITGGGGILLEHEILERYPRSYLVAEPVMANAIGFSRYGRRKWAK